MANIPVNFGGVILTANQSSSGNFAGIMCLGTGSVTNAAGSVISYLGYGNGLLSDGSANTAYMPATTTTTASVVITSASLAPFITPTGSFVVNGTTINITSNTAPAPTATTLSIRSQINLESYTQDFTNAFWDKEGGGVTATSSVTIAPDGTLTGNQITEVGGGGNVVHHIHDLAGSYIPVIGTTYHMSAYIKRPPVNADSYAQLTFWSAGFGPNAYVNFNIENATIGTSGTTIVDKGIIDAGNGWYRIYASAPATATGASGWQICFVSSPSASRGESYVVPLGSEESFYMWGAQVEKSGLTNYQATLTTPPSSSNLITASFNTYAPSYPTLKYITAAASGSTSTGLIFNTTTSLPGLLGNTYYITSGSTTTNFSGGTNAPALTLRAGDNVPLFITACGVSASSAPVLLYI